MDVSGESDRARLKRAIEAANIKISEGVTPETLDDCSNKIRMAMALRHSYQQVHSATVHGDELKWIRAVRKHSTELAALMLGFPGAPGGVPRLPGFTSDWLSENFPPENIKSVTGFIGETFLADLFRALADATLAMERAHAIRVKPARKKPVPHEHVFARRLAQVYLMLTEKRAGFSVKRGESEIGGPFVRFVGAVADEFEVDAPSPTTMSNALKQRPR